MNPLHTAEDALIKEGAKFVFDIAKMIFHGLGILAKTIDEDVKIHEAALNYCKRYDERHGQIKILGMGNPVPLKDIYTAVQCVSSEYLYVFSTPEELEKRFRETNLEKLFETRDKRDGLDIANQKQFLNVLGQPGAGKSTFLRRIGLEALVPRGDAGYKRNCLPILSN